MTNRATGHGHSACNAEVDCYGGYTALAKWQQQIALTFSWLHIRRKGFDLPDKSPVCRIQPRR